MDLTDTLIGIVVGATVSAAANWIINTRAKRDDRRRDAWASWAEQAYRTMAVRRKLVEEACSEQTPAGLQKEISQRLRRDIACDHQLNSAVAKVLLTDPSPNRRHQARAFTDLLAGAADVPSGADRHAVLTSHDRYLIALEATLDDLLGSFAEAGTTMQVRRWFGDRYRQLMSKEEPIQILHVDADEEGEP